MFENTINFINMFNKILDLQAPTQDEKDFVKTYEIEFVKNLFLDLDNEASQRIGRMLIGATGKGADNHNLFDFYNLPH